jgi:acetolactate synthase-1/2/3 large subunit
MRVADYIVARLSFLGIDTSFLVTGGGAMFLNDAIGASPHLKKIYCHHEQAASIAAEAYARIALKPALLNVTSGPGGINALNGIFGGFTDSIPMIVISGQVKRETLRLFNPIPGLRQLGDQEVNITAMAKPVTKWVHVLETAEQVVQKLDEAFVEAVFGRPGPVWLDVPVDLQGAMLPDHYSEFITKPLPSSSHNINHIREKMSEIMTYLVKANRPIIFAGSGIKISGTDELLLELAELLDIPVVTAWTHDIFPNEHPLFAGRPGTIGTRAGNFVVQNADLVLILGSRLNIRQVSYNWQSFAHQAKKIWVDIDPAEFEKPFVKADIALQADLKIFLPEFIQLIKASFWVKKNTTWKAWCRQTYKQFSPKAEDYPLSENAINPYHFIAELFKHLNANDVIVCGDATATIVPFQIGVMKKGMRMISNSGCASMGYDIPAALGCAIANPDARIICLAGDGSSMMNIQELETIKHLRLNILIFILNNDGYLSIKQTQRNFFKREAGSSSSSGISFPKFKKVGEAFDLNSRELRKDNWQFELQQWMTQSGPSLCDVFLDTDQEFEPRLKSKMVNDVITTPALDDMYPFMEVEDLNAIRASALKINS